MGECSGAAQMPDAVLRPALCEQCCGKQVENVNIVGLARERRTTTGDHFLMRTLLLQAQRGLDPAGVNCCSARRGWRSGGGARTEQAL